jgi:phosphoribosyl 1,2-cyclic phosphate phosphodiesterase
MKFTILGCATSSGVPLPGCFCEVCTSNNPRNRRTRCSGLLTTDAGKNILIDASPDLRYQAIKNKIQRIDAVLYTHAHADHILGTEDLRSFNFIQKSAIPCYGTAQTFDDLRKVFHYIFNPNPEYEGGGIAKLILHEINNFYPFPLFDIVVEPFLIMHGKMEVTGYKINKVAYATDCNAFTEKTCDLLLNIDHLIIDGLREEPHKTHFTIQEAVTTSKSINAQNTYITHLTHSVEYEKTSLSLPEGVMLAYDGLIIDC